MVPLPFGDGAVCGLDLDAGVAFRNLYRPCVIRPQHLEQGGRGHASDRELFCAVKKFTAMNFAVHVEVEQVEEFLGEVGCFFSFH